MDRFTPAPRLRDDVRVDLVDDDPVVVTAEGTTVCSLDPTAVRLWELCDGHTSLHDIVSRLLEGSSGPQQPAEARHVEAALERLVSASLLQWSWREQDDTIDLAAREREVSDPRTS